MRLVPGISEKGLTGAAIWYDGFMRNTERLTLSFILSASNSGAVVANYAKVTGFILEGKNILGAKVNDLLHGRNFEIRAKMTLNASGPWVRKVLGLLPQAPSNHAVGLSKVFCLVTRPITKDYAVAVFAKPMYRDKDSLVNKGAQLLFAIPWRNHSLIGSIHLPYSGDPDRFGVSKDDVKGLIDQFNEGYPSARLSMNDVRLTYKGMMPTEVEGSTAPKKHYEIINHQKEDGLAGLISIIGVKYTTARDVAEKAVNYVFKTLNIPVPKSKTARTPLYGGDIEIFDEFLKQEISKHSKELGENVLRHLIFSYGSAYEGILKYGKENAEFMENVSGSKEVIKAEIIHAIRKEMGCKLCDVVFRRTDLGTLGHPGKTTLNACADIMAHELGWDKARIQKEIADVESFYSLENGVLAQ